MSPQVAIHEVVVQVQAFALGRLHVGLPCREAVHEAKRERAARFEGAEDAHQAVRDAVAFGHVARRIFLAQRGAPRYSNGRPCLRARATACALTRSALDNRNGLTLLQSMS